MQEKTMKGKKIANRLGTSKPPPSTERVCLAVGEVQNGQAMPATLIINKKRMDVSFMR